MYKAITVGCIKSTKSFVIRPVGVDENAAVQQAIRNSLSMHVDVEDAVGDAITDPEILTSDGFLNAVKEQAANKIQGDPRNIVVSRLSIWRTALPYFRRKGFLSSAGILKVSFATFEEEEDAVDQGGPRREFFHLLLGAIARDSGIMCSNL